MDELKVKSTQFLLEKNPSASINSASVDVDDYISVANTNLTFMLPDTEKINDGDRAGRNAARHQCNTYWKQDDFQVTDDVDFIVLPRLLRRLMGGTPVRTLVATGVYDYVWSFLPPEVGNNLPPSGLAAMLAAAHFLMHGWTPDKANISWRAAERVKHQITGFGTGKWTQDPFDPEDYPDVVVPDCTEGRKKVVKYKDGMSTINMNTLGTLEEGSISFDNFLNRNYRRDGDPEILVEGVAAGYVQAIPRGSEQQAYQTMASITPLFQNLDDWKRSVKTKTLEDFSLMVPGSTVIATVSSVKYYNELEFMIPAFGFESITPANARGAATTQIGIIPFESDNANKGTMKVRLRTTETSFEGVSS